MERQFSLSRLFKLTKGAIILISSIFIIVSILLAVQANSGEIARQAESTCKQYTYLYRTAPEIESCVQSEIQSHNILVGSFFVVGILILAAFFGTTSVIKYIFPKADSN